MLYIDPFHSCVEKALCSVVICSSLYFILSFSQQIHYPMHLRFDKHIFGFVQCNSSHQILYYRLSELILNKLSFDCKLFLCHHSLVNYKISHSLKPKFATLFLFRHFCCSILVYAPALKKKNKRFCD